MIMCFEKKSVSGMRLQIPACICVKIPFGRIYSSPLIIGPLRAVWFQAFRISIHGRAMLFGDVFLPIAKH